MGRGGVASVKKGYQSYAMENEKYIKEVKKKTEIERTADDKTKTGVEIKGVKGSAEAPHQLVFETQVGVVPGERIELSCLSTMGLESIASANSAIPA